MKWPAEHQGGSRLAEHPRGSARILLQLPRHPIHHSTILLHCYRHVYALLVIETALNGEVL